MSKIDDSLRIKLPIWNAGMGLGISGAGLCSAVSNAGGLGVLGLGGMDPETMRTQLAEMRQRTSRAFAVNIILPMMQDGQIETCFDENVPLMVLFWGDPLPFVADAHKRGILVVSQCGDTDEAVRAAEAGVDGVIVQGIEAGGHVKATRPLADVVADTVKELGSLPVIAAGGIATGADIARALQLGASAASMGTRFVATTEATVRDDYKNRITAAASKNTVFTQLFDIGWPNATHRVIRNRAFNEWEAAGSPPSGQRPGEDRVIGTLGEGDQATDLPRYTVTPPLPQFHGDLEEAALYCGQSCDRIDSVLTTAELMEQLVAELNAAL
ncbi:MAG TPA: nitronate monooxygenase [Gammaproteobacteria bacterium]|nr:nitronate monooxygenase [Gammaproteobacteria bacterium]